MNVYLKYHNPKETFKKLENQALLTKLLYFNMVAICNMDSNPFDYRCLRNTMKPRECEELELQRSIKFLVDADLISFHPADQAVGHG
jgi:hypothetical protein